MALVARISFERELIERVLQGEREAQFEFYSLVRIYILRIGQSHYRLSMPDLEDIGQNICFSLFRNLACIEGDVGAWVNAAINRQLARIYKREEESATASSAPRVSSLAIEATIGIWEAMRQLNAFCKRLIITHIIQGYTRSQTAKAAGIPYGSVPYRRKQCLAELFENYKGSEPCGIPATTAGKS
jgi:DNA-directed RNA polymerase specialized sigma24 family protein